MCSLPKVQFPSLTIYLIPLPSQATLLSPFLPSGIHYSVFCIYEPILLVHLLLFVSFSACMSWPPLSGRLAMRYSEDMEWTHPMSGCKFTGRQRREQETRYASISASCSSIPAPTCTEKEASLRQCLTIPSPEPQPPGCAVSPAESCPCREGERKVRGPLRWALGGAL